MKKALSLFITICLCITMLSTVFQSVLADTSPLKTYNIDITQNPADCLFTNDSYLASASVTKDNKLAISVNHTAHNINGGNKTVTWVPNYGLRDSAGAITATLNDKIMVNVVYKVTDTTSGFSVGIGGWDNIKNNAVVVQTYKNHTSADVGKEFALSTTFVCSKNNNNNVLMNRTKVVFRGVGSFEISEITLSILKPEGFDDYCSLTTVDNDISKSSFVAKGSVLPIPVKENYTFLGWYGNKEFTGDKITTVSSDSTVYARWKSNDGSTEITYVDKLNGKNETKKCKVGDAITDIPTNPDYNFLGWYRYEDYLGRPAKTVTEDMSKLYAKWESKYPAAPMYVDLSQTPQFNFTQKTLDAGTNVSVNKDNHLVVDVHNYERQLSKTQLNTQTWFPNYVFKDTNGKVIALEKGSTYNVEVTYDVVKIRGGTDTGVQMGLGADYQTTTNRCYMKSYKMHDNKSDMGKEFIYSVTYTVDSNIYPRLMFSGDGIIEVKEIKIVKSVPLIKDTVIGVQDYESFEAGSETGVLGDKKGTTVATSYNHTASGKKSLQLQMATDMARLSGNTIISLDKEGKMRPFQAENGASYKVSFYITSSEDMKDVVWNVGTAAEDLLSDYLRHYTLETRGKTDIKAGEWTKVVAYISSLKGSGVANNYFDISVASSAYDGKNVYIDDVEIEQLLDSELIIYDTLGGDALTPSRAFADNPINSLKEATRADYLFDGWYYDKEYKNEAKLGDIFPKAKEEIILYAKWVKPNTEAVDFTAGSFDKDIYPENKVPYTNRMENIDSEIYFEGSSTMTRDVVWMEDAGICGNGTAEVDGAVCLSNEFFSYRDDAKGYNALRLMNADGTPFTVVKGGRYTLSLDYVCASSRAVAYLVPVISEQSAYGDFGYNTPQTLTKISVQATDSDYQTATQSFIAQKTGYVYILLTGRDDNQHAEQHCYERICIDNVKINVNNDVVKLDYMGGSDLYFTHYGIKGEKDTAPNLLVEKSGSKTAIGVYTDKELTKEFDGFFPDQDSICYIDLKDVKYNIPSDFTNPISLNFEENDILKYFYNQSKFITSWSRELTNEWIYVSNDPENALSGGGYIRLNPFGHYWNEAKFAFYDVNNPTHAMLLSMGQKYRVSVMVRCIDPYEVPNGLYVCLELPSERFLLRNNGTYKLEYDPKGDKDGYYRFVGDIEVSEDLGYLPTLALRRAPNDLQGLYIDNVTVEQLKNCTVSYDANGGSAIDPIEVQIHDFAIDPGVPYREGYDFAGWFIDSALTKAWDFDNDTVEGDMTLYAKWTVEKPEEVKPTVTEKVIEDEDDNTPKPVKISNGKAPELLEADKVVLDQKDSETNTDTAEEAGLPLWAIILIAAGGALVLAAGVILVIIFVRKKSQKQ